MKTHQWTKTILTGMMLLLLSACQDWGEWDDPSGNQRNPVPPDASVKVIAHFPFDTDFAATGTDINGEPLTYESGERPEIVADSKRGNVLHLKGGYLRIPNPMQGLYVAAGASVSMWVKMPEVDTEGALFSFVADKDSALFFTGNAWLNYKGRGSAWEVNNPQQGETQILKPNQWHFLAISLTNAGYIIYVDGEKKQETRESSAFDYPNMVSLITTAPYFYLGYGSPAETKEVYFDDVKIWKNKIAAKDALPDQEIPQMPTPVYLNTFDANNTARIVGGGSFTPVTDPGFGVVFQNATGGMRQNYLLLPENVLSHSTETNEMSIGVWVNAANAGASGDYMWSPLFTAYGAAPVNNENTWPMLALQYRGVVQVNNAGWCDFTDAQNIYGTNKLYHDATDWLVDHDWHYYTATFTETTAKVYFDGVPVNEWEVDGATAGSVIKGLFSNGADLKYICLGGNQAWGWGDPDPGFMFDDIAVYDAELTADQIAYIIAQKKGVTPQLPAPVYLNTFDANNTAQIVGDGSFTPVTDPGFGVVFQNATGGMRKNYLLLPENVLSHSTESNEMSISVWVNAANAGASNTYMWSPLLTAYGAAPVNNENTWPMLALQYRGLVQVNCAGWCDFTDAQNVNGANILYHDATDWLADHKWHYYTATLTETTAKVYFDGKLVNAWEVDGTTGGSVIKGLFSNGADLKYICLGGNQAWNWGDQDP
ncbi:MAG: LamG domain-containing protein, partial [Candidatus Symbiothrix sp.]|nr:LamG domain-containing protein [Candidatus Symbiothrix sp.]